MLRKARTKTGRGTRRIPGSYCRVCATAINRERRAGKVETPLTPEELALVREFRAEMKLAEFDGQRAAPAGRHHAPA